MRPAIACVLALVLLAGCSGGSDTASTTGGAATSSSATTTTASAAAPTTPAPLRNASAPEVSSWDGHVTVAAGAGGPAGYQGASPQDDPHPFHVPAGATAVVLELVWSAAGPVPAQPMTARAIGPGDAYYFASGGDGTPASPVVLAIEDAAEGDWTAAGLVSEGVAADQDYSFRLSVFHDGAPPPGYSAFAGDAS